MRWRPGTPGSILLVALTLSAGAATALSASLAPPPAAPEGGCNERDGIQACAWSFSDEDATTILDPRTFEIPTYPMTIAAFEVGLIGRDNGWTLILQYLDIGNTWRNLSRATHSATTDASYRHSQTSAQVIFADGAPHRIMLLPQFSEENNTVPAGPRSAGRWNVTYNGERAPPGETPYRPAADADHPHLRDLRGDTPRPENDILAAWFTDAVLDDGLIEAHIRLADLPSEVSMADEVGLTAAAVGWKLAWRLDETTYFVEWLVRATGSGQGRTCELRSETDGTRPEPVLATPYCVFDETTDELTAVFPVRSIGSPRDGVPFVELAARARVHSLVQQDPDVVDDATVPDFLFAMGGPRVWAVLDSGALGPASAPWYEAPFAEDNVVDSVQVLASIIASVAFFVGLIIVAKRRRRTNALLHRIDDSMRGDIDSQATLLRLGRLETEFSEMYRRGRLTEGQYQVLSQRIASVATRHSLRHSLGLDDGIPGDDRPLRVDVAGGRESHSMRR